MPTTQNKVPPKQSRASEAWNWTKRHKRFASIVSFVTLVVTIIGFYVVPQYQHHLDYQDDAFNDAVDRRIDALTMSKLGEMGGRVAKIEGELIGLILQQASMHPDKRESALEVIESMAALTARKQRLDPALVASVGKSFISAAGNVVPSKSGEPNWPWQAALATINYRTTLNFDFMPKVEGPRQDPNCVVSVGITHTDVPALAYSEFPFVVTKSGNATPGDSAKLERLDSPNVPCQGARYLIVQQPPGSILLDQFYFKNVVIMDATVEYRGGPVKLEDVIFVNCQFELHPQSRGRQLGDLLLASASVSFAPTNIAR